MPVTHADSSTKIEAIKNLETLSAIERAHVLNEAAWENRYNNPKQTLELAQQALEISTASVNREGRARALRNIGIAQIGLANFKEALSSLQQSYVIYQDLNDSAAVAAVTGNIGIVYKCTGQYDLALEWYSRSLQLAQELGLEEIIAKNLSNIAEVYLATEQYQLAQEYYTQANEILLKINDRYTITINFAALGQVLEKLGRYEEALQMLHRGLNYATDISNNYALAQIRMNIGTVYFRTGKYEDARRHLSTALEIQDRTGNKLEISIILAQICRVCAVLDNLEDALVTGRRALELAMEIESLPEISEAHLVLSNVYELKGDHAKALVHYKNYCEIRTQLIKNFNTQSLGSLQQTRKFEKAESEREIYRLKYIELGKALWALEEKNKQIEAIHRDMMVSIEYARKIQETILPQEIHLKAIFPAAFLFYKPKNIICGDFCWIGQKNNLSIAAAIDSTGYGVPAAFISIVGYTLLNDIVLNKGITEPAKILNQLNTGFRNALHQDNTVAEEFQSADGMEISICTIDTVAHEVQYAGACNPLYILKRNQLEEIKPDKFPVGGTQTETFRLFTNHRFNYSGGETLYLCTDGIANQVGGEKKTRYQSRRLKEFIISIRNQEIEKQGQSFLREIENWRQNCDQTDDILVLGIRL
jgi:tetratricopeptide (TPR) repeat protein